MKIFGMISQSKVIIRIAVWECYVIAASDGRAAELLRSGGELMNETAD